MSPIKVTISATGAGGCALTGRECDGLTVAFEDEPAAFLSWKAFRQLVTMKAGKHPKPASPAVPNGAAAVK
jgi:hypothetical protein